MEACRPVGAPLVTWVGPDAYVSPSFYPSKEEHGRVVPTWNFITVQATGPVTFHEDDEWKRTHVTSLTAFHEEGTPAPWSVDDAPPDYVAGLIRSIVGVELRVTSIEGKWKLSQNRTDPDIAGVISGLRTQGSESAASVAREIAIHAVQRRADPSCQAPQALGHLPRSRGAEVSGTEVSSVNRR